MKRAIVFLLALSALVYPFSVVITPFEYKDLGNLSNPPMNVTMVMDCDAKTLTSHVTSQGDPVPGVTTMLKYVQYDNPLISSGTTDSNGYVTHQLIGNIDYMTGIFVLVMEKNGYMNREAHFLIDPCFLPEPPQPPPAPPEQNATPPANETPPSPPETNITPPVPPVPPLENETAPSPPSPNITQNETTNQTSLGGSTIPFCPIGFFLGVLGIIALYQSRR